MPKISAVSSKTSKHSKGRSPVKPKPSRTPSKSAPKSILKKPKADVPNVDFAELHNDTMSEDVPQALNKQISEESGTESIHLQGFSDDDGASDSSDDDDGVIDEIQASDLPTISKDDAVVRKRLEVAKKEKSVDRGVIYLGHIPHGFYETEMKGFFSQFGTVTKLRLSRSKKTARPRGYAFIEFDSATVAEIVADVMNNYLLFSHLLKCKIVPKEKVHPRLWVGANKPFRKVDHAREALKTHNRKRTVEQQERANNRLLSRQTKRAAKIKDAGIDFDITATGYQQRPSVAA